MPKAVVKLRYLGGTHATRSILNQPLSESVDKGPVLVARNFPGTFNGRFVGAKSYVLHIYTIIVYTIFVQM